MARTFEGDLSQLSESQLAFIGEVLDKNGYSDAKVTFHAVGEAGDNYVANVKRIVAEKDGETFKIIAKVAPTIPQLRVQMKTHDLFHNEYIMYSRVLPKFTQLENSVGIPENERLRYATCYGCLMDEPNELILLEDLQVAGFVMLDRFKAVTEDVVRQALRSFGKLHALSYVLRQREPECFESLKNSLYKIWLDLVNSDFMKILFKSIVNDALRLLDDQKQKDIVKNTLSIIPEILRKLTESDADSKFSVIQQGDSWTTNLMFQLEEGTAVSCCMIDYQISRINSPVADLLYFIFNCTDYETRAKHYYDWIDYYHSELNNHLSEYGLKVHAIYPRDILDADLRRHGKSALIFACMIGAGRIKTKEDSAKLKELMEKTDLSSNNNFESLVDSIETAVDDHESAALFKATVGGAIDSLFEFGLI